MSPWHKPGHIARFGVPREHVVGHEQADNDVGPRPWLIVFNRFAGQSGLVIAVPLVTHRPPYATHTCVPLEPDDIDTTGAASPISGAGFVALDQVRALSLVRSDAVLCGKMRQDAFNALREELASMLHSLPRRP